MSHQGIFRHALRYLSGEVFGKALPFLTLPLFTRWLTVDEFGIVSLFLLIFQFFSELFGLGLRGTYVRYIHDEKEDGEQYYNSIILMVVYSFVLFLILLSITRNAMLKFLDTTIEIFWIAVLCSFFDALFKIQLSKLEAEAKSKLHVKYNVSRVISLFALSLILVYSYSTDKHMGRIHSQLVVFLIFALIVFIPHKKISFNLHKEHLKYALGLGIPLLLHLMAGFILNISDQAIINSILGKYELGIYSVAYRIGIIVQVVVIAVQKAWVPNFYKSMNQDLNSIIQTQFMLYGKIVIVFAFILIVYKEQIYAIFAPIEYFNGISMVPYIVIGYIFYFLYTIYSQYLLYYKKNIVFSTFTISSGLINLGANYILIPRYGAIGAAYATLISFAILFLLNYLFCLFTTNIKGLINVKSFFLDFIFATALLFGFNYLNLICSFNLVEILILKFVWVAILLIVIFYRVKGKVINFLDKRLIK